MFETPPIEGVIPAVLLPRDAEGAVNWAGFARNIEFLLKFDVAGVCVNGATGEYASASAAERREAVRIAREAVERPKLVVSGVGAVTWRDVVALAADSEEAGADVLLIPAPHFFRYSQGDLAEFFTATAGKLRVPALLYNLAAFTGGIDAQVAVRLIDEVEGIAGIKDSSGQLTTLEALSAKGRRGAVRLVGHDGVLAEAIGRGLCDGTISGVAGVLPELTLAVWKSGREGEERQFAAIVEHQRKLLAMLDRWPVPWALKIIAEWRGLMPAVFELPLSARRRDQMTSFRKDFEAWWEAARPDVERVVETAAQIG